MPRTSCYFSEAVALRFALVARDRVSGGFTLSMPVITSSNGRGCDTLWVEGSGNDFIRNEAIAEIGFCVLVPSRKLNLPSDDLVTEWARSLSSPA